MNEEYKTGRVLFVKPYGNEDGYYGFIHPFGESGRKHNVYFTEKAVSPLLDSVIRQYNKNLGGTVVVDVVFRAEPSDKGPRAVEVFLR